MTDTAKYKPFLIMIATATSLVSSVRADEPSKAIPPSSMLFQSSEQQTSLLELYTSEGCSSCPPAESWVSQLKNADGLWSKFVPVAFHISYWNNLGWRDRFSDEKFSRRQQEYAQSWSEQNIYTPEFVLNGREWVNWREYHAPPSVAAPKTGILQASSDDGRHWRVAYTPSDGGTKDYDVSAAFLISEVHSDVKAGENVGRRLNHDFAVLSFIKLPLVKQGNSFQGNFEFKTPVKEANGRQALAVWTTRHEDLSPLQATGGWIGSPERAPLPSP